MSAYLTVSLTHLCSPILLLNTKQYAKAKAAINVPVRRCFFLVLLYTVMVDDSWPYTSVTYSFWFHKLSVVSAVALSLLACSIPLVNTKLTNSPEEQLYPFWKFDLWPGKFRPWAANVSIEGYLIIQSIVWTKGQRLKHDLLFLPLGWLAVWEMRH